MSAGDARRGRSIRDFAFLASLVLFALFAVLFIVRIVAGSVSFVAIAGMVLVVAFAASGLWKRSRPAGDPV